MHIYHGYLRMNFEKPALCSLCLCDEIEQE